MQVQNLNLDFNFDHALIIERETQQVEEQIKDISETLTTAEL